MPEQPNIVLIMDDQHRWDWLGCAGAGWVSTPNIDKLAERGVRFTACCTNAPVCAPSRIALAAGCQPHRLGAQGNNAFYPLSHTTCYQRLRDAGYHVGCVGKLDLAKPAGDNGRAGNRPLTYAWGFTHPVECEGKMHAGRERSPGVPCGPYGHDLQKVGLWETMRADYARRKEQGWAFACDDSPLPTEWFEDAYIGRRSCEWVQQASDEYPFHLFVSFVGPHDPFDPPTEYADRYRDADMPEPIPFEPEGKSAAYARGERKRAYEDGMVLRTRRQYAAAIELIDDQVGAIVEALEAKGVLDNTCIMFASDHGEMLGDHARYAKSVPYEPALRVPLIAAGPGIAGGRVSDANVELIDVNATICDLAGLPPQPDIDAISFKPVLDGDATQHRTECISGLSNFRLIRTERYKLVQYVGDKAELYDLQEDPAERRNIIDEQPEVCRELSDRLSKRFLEGGCHR